MELPPAPDHEQFVAGMRQQTTACHFLGEPFQFLTPAQKKKFAVFVVLYAVAPIVLVPLWAYHERNWWLLVGVIAAFVGLFLGSRASTQGGKATSGGFLPILLIVLWFTEGFRGRDTFYTLCATWSWALYLMADAAQRHWAEENLVASKDTYERAVADKRVVIIPKEA